jgi:hypothetical protein
LAECHEPERHTRAARLPHRGESDGIGGDLFGQKRLCKKSTSNCVGKGSTVHDILGSSNRLSVTCSHITFVGKGKDHTTIRGGFAVENQQDVRFEGLAVTETGLYLHGSETNVDVLKCAVKWCGGDGPGDGGMCVYSGATVTATQCEFMGNDYSGVYCDGANTKVRLDDCTVYENAVVGLWANGFERSQLLSTDNPCVVDLHGTKTDIRFNEGNGIYASSRAKVNIHLPSQHNTSHDNGLEDRLQEDDGASIANINADGTFTYIHTP